MDRFFGWVGVPTPSASAVPLLTALDTAGTGTLRHHRNSHSAIATVSEGVTLYQDERGWVLLAGQPRWRDRVPPIHEEFARQLIELYRVDGIDMLHSVVGSFALAIALDGGRDGLLAVDRMGVFAAHYRILNGAVTFGSTADVLCRVFDVNSDIDPQSVFNYVYFHNVPGPSTIYRGQFRVAPGGYVRAKDGRVTVGRYWLPAYDEAAQSDTGALKEEFRRLLKRSVADISNCNDNNGTFLSGGTDSSTVAGMLTGIQQRPARTYSIGFQVEGYDEIEYARIAARHFATDHHEYYVTPDDVVALVPRLAAFCDQPFGNASAVPTYHCARLAKSDGVAMMLGGDGGDELFGGNERYATQAVYEWYGRVPRLLRRGLFERTLSRIPPDFPIALLRKGGKYVRQAATPLPQRLHVYNMLNREPLSSVFTEDFLAGIDPSVPMSITKSIYDGARAHSMLNRTLALDLEVTLANNDLYKVNRMCELAGVRVAYPMLNDDLVAFSLRLPAELKVRGTKLRYFFKEALRDFLPEQIINKPKHGFGLPIGIWMRSHGPLRDLAYDAVRALATRGVIRLDFIERILSEHRSGHAAYWGTEIWALAQLELWLRAHGHARGQALV